MIAELIRYHQSRQRKEFISAPWPQRGKQRDLMVSFFAMMALFQSKLQKKNQLSTGSGLISFVGPANWVVELFETNSPALCPSSPASLPTNISLNSSLRAQPVKTSLSGPLSSLSAYSFTMTVSNSNLIFRNVCPSLHFSSLPP